MKNKHQEKVDKLSNLFGAIANKNNWRAPINRRMNVSAATFAMFSEAVEFYHANPLRIVRTEADGTMIVANDGYTG